MRPTAGHRPNRLLNEPETYVGNRKHRSPPNLAVFFQFLDDLMMSVYQRLYLIPILK